jgi:hypothetical protein
VQADIRRSDLNGADAPVAAIPTDSIFWLAWNEFVAIHSIACATIVIMPS